ncbi:hypothetical protein MLD63_01030 (plasmid) [Paracoccus sp. TK19116]|uniref:Uncharacterized protein n=1 Tax=Paracoccus albicereus TaxID=2922394 RepID=A0ABT1MNJ5_9RHOB|nr:hypothetical protein [Paracoccus albicereus]MCQ0969018.1 hypothetical protein [Paracoccus albicereus]
MTRHLSDKPRETGAARMREYTRQERENGRHPSTVALHERPRSAGDGNRKLREFTRIDRGGET